MNTPFLYLTAHSLKNRVRKRLRRLREPRYLAGLLAGLAYLYWFVVRNQVRASSRTARDLLQLGPYVQDIVAGAAVLLWLGVVLVWLWPFPAQPWSFTAPEVQFFFTAPVSRRRLLNYKLLRSQVGVLFTVLMISFFSGAARAAAAGRWSFMLGGWIFFATLQLHVRGATLTKLAFRAPTTKVPRLAWASSGAIVILSGALIGAVAVNGRALLGEPTAVIFRAVLDLARGAQVSALLWPFAAAVRPIFALTSAAFLTALGPALIVLVVHYWWVVSSDARLEEAAAAAESRQSRKRSAPVLAARPAPFTLAPLGRPETAILWKNTILLGRYFSIMMLVRILIPLTVLAIVFGLRSGGSRFAPLLGVLVLFITILGPYMVRNDLRHDMSRLAVLKTWPVSGRQLLVGELLAPTLVLTVVVWFLLAVTVALAPAWRFGPHDAVGRLAVAAAVAVAAPMMIAGQLLIQNAAVVVFPGWVATGGGRARGIEAMGQNMLMFAGTLLALALGVLPAAVVSGGLGFLLYQVAGWPAVFPSAVVMTAILALETWLVVLWLGRVLDRTDPAQVEVAE